MLVPSTQNVICGQGCCLLHYRVRHRTWSMSSDTSIYHNSLSSQSYAKTLSYKRGLSAALLAATPRLNEYIASATRNTHTHTPLKPTSLTRKTLLHRSEINARGLVRTTPAPCGRRALRRTTTAVPARMDSSVVFEITGAWMMSRRREPRRRVLTGRDQSHVSDGSPRSVKIKQK